MHALVDAARSPIVHDGLRSLLPGTCVCLYDEPEATELGKVAPYLVDVAPNGTRLIHRLWAQSTVVLVSSRLTTQQLREHFRLFVVVRAGDKERYFRFYDPRVLRGYLPTCTFEELALFFGEIDALIAESADKRDALIFRRVAGQLNVEALAGVPREW